MINEKVVKNFVPDNNDYDIFPQGVIFGTPKIFRPNMGGGTPNIGGNILGVPNMTPWGKMS